MFSKFSILEHSLFSLLGFFVIFSYYLAIGDGLGLYPWKGEYKNYFEHPGWFGLNTNTTKSITILQLFAAIGYLMFYIYISSTSPKRGILSYSLKLNENFEIKVSKILIFCYLFFSSFWSFALHRYHVNKTFLNLMLNCASLWIVALTVILFIAGVFEDNAKAIYVIGVLFMGLINVLADGVGWTSTLILDYLESKIH